jgi:hypothetical protein
MIKHGASHGLAYAVSTVASSLFIAALSSLMPDVMNRMNTLAGQIMAKLNLKNVDQGEVQSLLVAFVLCYLWGAGFKHLESRED